MDISSGASCPCDCVKPSPQNNLSNNFHGDGKAVCVTGCPKLTVDSNSGYLGKINWKWMEIATKTALLKRFGESLFVKASGASRFFLELRSRSCSNKQKCPPRKETAGSSKYI